MLTLLLALIFALAPVVDEPSVELQRWQVEYREAALPEARISVLEKIAAASLIAAPSPQHAEAVAQGLTDVDLKVRLRAMDLLASGMHVPTALARLAIAANEHDRATRDCRKQMDAQGRERKKLPPFDTERPLEGMDALSKIMAKDIELLTKLIELSELRAVFVKTFARLRDDRSVAQIVALRPEQISVEIEPDIEALLGFGTALSLEAAVGLAKELKRTQAIIEKDLREARALKPGPNPKKGAPNDVWLSTEKSRIYKAVEGVVKHQRDFAAFVERMNAKFAAFASQHKLAEVPGPEESAAAWNAWFTKVRPQLPAKLATEATRGG